MSKFTENEVRYLKSQRLGRLATAGVNGQPHVVPVGFRFDADAGTLEIGGLRMAQSKKFRDLQKNLRVAFVVDDLISVDPWRPRGVEVRGRVEVFEDGGDRFGPGWDKAWIRIIPEHITAWGIDGDPFHGANVRSVS